MRVPCFLAILERHVSTCRLYVVVVVELLECELLSLVVKLAYTLKQVLVERAIDV